MNAREFTSWAAKYVKTRSFELMPPESRQRRRYEQVASQRAEALGFLRDRGPEADLDALAGDPPEITLLNLAIRVDDQELALALLAAGASPTRIFAAASRADEGPSDRYVEQRPLWLARKKGARSLVTALATAEALAVEAEDERQIAASTPGPGAAHAHVYALRDRWVFVPQSGGGGGHLWMPGAVALERTARARDVAAALNAVLDAFVDSLADEDARKHAQRDTLAAAGLRSYRALRARASLVSVDRDDDRLFLESWGPDGPGYAPSGAPVVLPRPTSDEALVQALIEAAGPAGHEIG